MVMQIPFLLSTGKVKTKTTNKTPAFVEKKKNNQKICFLLKGSVNGNKKTGSNKRRSGNTRSS